MSREIICPAIYRHFKGKHYATICCSQYIEADKLFKLIEKNNIKLNDKTRITVFYTENFKIEIGLYKIGENYYHLDSDMPKELVIYRPLYPFKYHTVARPKTMFESKVDKEKYPDVKQEYRFELVKY